MSAHSCTTIEHAKGPYRARRVDLGAIEVRDTKSKRDLGMYARYDIPNNTKIIEEVPAISCVHWKGKKTIAQEWLKLPVSEQQSLVNGLHRLKGLPVGALTLKPKEVKQLEAFIRDYGFLDPQKARAHIFPFTGHINHACARCANAQLWVDSAEPHSMTVTMVKDVKADDEIFIHYNRNDLAFGCALCSSGAPLKDRLFDWAKSKPKNNKPASQSSGVLPMVERNSNDSALTLASSRT